jgi:hypothetical protein
MEETAMFHKLLAFAVAMFAIVLLGCTPTREITYSLKDIPVDSDAATVAVTRNVSLRVEPFEDIRKTVAENGVLFVRERETKLNDKESCINSEEHYKENTVPDQVAKITAGHLGKRRTFKSVVSGKDSVADFFLTGRIRRLYGEQEVSQSAKVGSMFGLIGALATAGATTDGNIVIEFTDLVVHRASDGAEKRLEDVTENFSGELDADAYCWCIYENVNEHVKAAVDRLARSVESGVADLVGSTQ